MGELLVLILLFIILRKIYKKPGNRNGTHCYSFPVEEKRDGDVTFGELVVTALLSFKLWKDKKKKP